MCNLLKISIDIYSIIKLINQVSIIIENSMNDKKELIFFDPHSNLTLDIVVPGKGRRGNFVERLK